MAGPADLLRPLAGLAHRLTRGSIATAWLAAAIVSTDAQQLARQDVPTIDAEDATPGSVKAGPGGLRLHATAGIRNGDYARGAYDDDDARLNRLPVHITAGFASVLHATRSALAVCS